MNLPHPLPGRSLILVVALFTGCATLGTRTEGVSGPLAWRAANPHLVKHVVEGQAREDYAFTLIVRNTSDATLTLTRMEHTVYQAGGGQAGRGAISGRVELKPNEEWRFPLSSYRYCNSPYGCTYQGITAGTTAPLWKIVFTGTDDQGRPLRVPIDLALPAEAAGAPFELSAARRPLAPSLPLEDAPPRPPSPTSRQAAAPQPAGPPASLGQVTPQDLMGQFLATVSKTPELSDSGAIRDVAAPIWQPGYEWEFQWESPRGKGTFVWSVDRIEVLDGTEFYVIKSGASREIYRRKSDVAFYMDKVFEGIEERHVPPSGASWPLSLSKTWEVRYTRERPIDRETEQMVRTCRVEAVERIGVPAGLFDTWKIACRDPQSALVTDEVWYSPEVKHWVKERTRFRYGIRDRELIRYSIE